MFKLSHALAGRLRACFYMFPATAQLTDQSDPELRSRGGQHLPPLKLCLSFRLDSEATLASWGVNIGGSTVWWYRSRLQFSSRRSITVLKTFTVAKRLSCDSITSRARITSGFGEHILGISTGDIPHIVYDVSSLPVSPPVVDEYSFQLFRSFCSFS